MYIFTVRGRQTGRAYSTSVRLIEDGERWLVGRYGEVGGVRNARAAGKVEIRRAGRSETLSIEEVSSDQSAQLPDRAFCVGGASPILRTSSDIREFAL